MTTTDEGREAATYTPTFERIREEYLEAIRERGFEDLYEAEFDLSLAAHDAEIHAAGVVEGIRIAREAAERLAATLSDPPAEIDEWWNPADVAAEIRRTFESLETTTRKDSDD